jgi:hypothetical protein
MTALWWTLAALALSMLALNAVIFEFGSSRIMVPPPETVARDFVRHLHTGRFSVARDGLSEQLRAQTTGEQLKRMTQELQQRTGEWLDVGAEEGWIRGDYATAYSKIRTKTGANIRLRFPLVRHEGEWKISGLGALRKN